MIPVLDKEMSISIHLIRSYYFSILSISEAEKPEKII